jgi:hypothetical protein
MEADQASAVREARQNLRVTLSISLREVNARNQVHAVLSLHQALQLEPDQDVARSRPQPVPVLQVISEEGVKGKEPKEAAVELETPDIAVIATNHRRVARRTPRATLLSCWFEARDTDSQTILEF